MSELLKHLPNQSFLSLSHYIHIMTHAMTKHHRGFASRDESYWTRSENLSGAHVVDDDLYPCFMFPVRLTWETGHHGSSRKFLQDWIRSYVLQKDINVSCAQTLSIDACGGFTTNNCGRLFNIVKITLLTSIVEVEGHASEFIADIFFIYRRNFTRFRLPNLS